MRVEHAYNGVKYLDIGEPSKHRIPVKVKRTYSGIWVALTVLFFLSTVGFAYIALKNARMIECIDTRTDVYGRLICMSVVEL